MSDTPTEIETATSAEATRCESPRAVGTYDETNYDESVYGAEPARAPFRTDDPNSTTADDDNEVRATLPE